MKQVVVIFFLSLSLGVFSQSYNNPGGTINTCSGTFYDTGGASGDYSDDEWVITTICSNAGNCIVVDFTSFNLESGYDDIYIYDGPSTASPLIGIYTGTNSPGTITSTTGCLTFDFASDWTETRAGWAATISCVTCPLGPPEDCLGGTTICSDNTFSGNSSGFGTQELISSNDGCLSGENQSSWYFFQATAAGTIEFTISPQNGMDDYDFAVWGPYPSTSTPGDICPPATSPLRCSYADGWFTPTANTGLQAGAGHDSEDEYGDGWVNPINMNVGDVYILVIDNYSVSGDPFDLDINLTNGASLDCTPLPIDLMSFTGDATELGNELYWQTMAEINNDYFVIESSVDAGNFSPIGNIDGAGNSVQPIDYYFLDQDPIAGVTYYRLKQVDFDGKFSYSDIVAVKRLSAGEIVLTPNPVKDILNVEINVAEGGLYSFVLTDLLGSNHPKRHCFK